MTRQPDRIRIGLSVASRRPTPSRRSPTKNLIAPEVQTAQTREVAENTSAGTNLGPPIAANDPGDVLTYSLDAGADAMAFGIVRSSGQLQTKEDLDFETKPEYGVTVRATDPFGSPVTSIVTITVTDVNEDPILTAEAASIDVAENGTHLDDDGTSDVMEGRIHRHRRGHR